MLSGTRSRSSTKARKGTPRPPALSQSVYCGRRYTGPHTTFFFEITNDEYLLLSVLIFCNPALLQLSENGKLLLTIYRNLYCSALLQHCLLNNQKSGPARFTELLGVYQAIEVHYSDLANYIVLFQLNRPKVNQIVKNCFEAVT
ncbi:Nuclear Hormone Receptor family [Caenorhabditis elegans]|uniref:Nuclear Hormone Receptor family n=1 Tax=Caenorhabditis elegans TaxID=6239 RepID=Q9TZB4_CAEEL|nr:Nuclear Hormone Receptor family [Caenorhabditis elegans]CCD66072.1 Nuclear Hormone Receptor family [Caenorhabditis elegans]|eukprot:NP_497150.1 Nuclear Hormone Receptor family [Caenorhabditis elegans]